MLTIILINHHDNRPHMHIDHNTCHVYTPNACCLFGVHVPYNNLLEQFNQLNTTSDGRQLDL